MEAIKNNQCEKKGNRIIYCSKMAEDLTMKIRFEEISPGNILSIPDDKFINYCPFCGFNLGK